MTRATTYRLLAVVALCGMGAYRFQTMRRPEDVTRYHAAIRTSVARVPRQIDGWVGQDIPVPPQAVMLLQPNVMVSKQYINVDTGAVAKLLLVHCADAHAMAGHFPLRCYPAQDWKVEGMERRDWRAGDLSVPGMEYHFSKPAQVAEGRGPQAMTVYNFLLRPGGHVVRDMDEMTALVRGAGGEALGSAQVQVCFDGDTPREARDRAMVALVRGYRPVIDTILSDPAAYNADGGDGGTGAGAAAEAAARADGLR